MRLKALGCSIITVLASLLPSGVASASVPASHFSAPVVGIAYDPTGWGGFWIAASDGEVEAHGDAAFFGDASRLPLNAPIVSITATADGRGYWLAAADGGVFAFGDAPFYGSMGGVRLNAPVTAFAPTTDGRGYWLLGRDGGVFAFGDAPFYGAENQQPVQAVAIANLGGVSGYQVVNADGSGITMMHSKGGGQAALPFKLNMPVVGMAVDQTSKEGYWLVAADGGVFSLLGAPFYGSTAGQPHSGLVVGISATPTGDGYVTVDQAGNVTAFGNAW